AIRRYVVFVPVYEGLLPVQALRTAHGQMPYVDFHTGYGPLYFWLQAWLLEAGGWDAIRWALVAVHGAAGALLFVLARRLAGPALAWAAVALEVAFFLPVALAAVALVAPSGLTVTACVLAPPVVALAALGARRGVADGDALRRLAALAAGFVPPLALSFAPSVATVGPRGLAREIGAGVA